MILFIIFMCEGGRRRTKWRANIKCSWLQLPTLWLQQRVTHRYDRLYEKPQSQNVYTVRTMSIIFHRQQSIRDAWDALPSARGLRWWRQRLKWELWYSQPIQLACAHTTNSFLCKQILLIRNIKIIKKSLLKQLHNYLFNIYT